MIEYRFVQASGAKELTRKVNEAAKEGFELVSTKMSTACISKAEYEGACALVLLATLARDVKTPVKARRT